MAQSATHHQCAYAQPSATIRLWPNVTLVINTSATVGLHRLAPLAPPHNCLSKSRPYSYLFTFFLDTLIQQTYIFNLYHLYQVHHRHTGEIGGQQAIQNQRCSAPDRPKHLDAQALGKTGTHSQSPQRLKGLANLHGGRSPGNFAACQRDKLLSKYRSDQIAR